MASQTEKKETRKASDLAERMETHAENLRCALEGLASLWGLSQQQELH